LNHCSTLKQANASYEAQKDLFNFLNLEKNPKMHWLITFCWVMAQHMHGTILKAIKYVVETT